MLRNLAAQKEQQAHNQATSEVYDKLRMLNGQGWPRPAPWYPGAAAFGGIGPPCVPPVPPPASHGENGGVLSSSEKKGKPYDERPTRACEQRQASPWRMNGHAAADARRRHAAHTLHTY